MILHITPINATTALFAFLFFLATAFLLGLYVATRRVEREESAAVEYHRKRAESRERYARELSDKLTKALNDNADLRMKGASK